MANIQKIGETVRQIVQTGGEDALLDAFSALETFSQMAPGFREEKGLLQAFLLCDGLEQLRQVRSAAPGNRAQLVEPLVSRMCRDFDMERSTAEEVCREVYRGLTGSRLTGVSLPDTTPVATIPVRKPPVQEAPPPKTPIPATEPELSGSNPERTEAEPSRPSGKNPWLIPVLIGAVAVLLVIVILLLLRKPEADSRPETQATPPAGESIAHQHTWREASCTMAQVCTACGETVGMPMGHLWIDASCTSAQSCLRCGQTTGEPLEHIWSEGSCTQSPFCVNCGAASGIVMDHTWLEATCTSAKTCALCGITEGLPLEHVWQEAWYETPETCILCGLTQGRALLHDPDRPYEKKIDVILSYYKDVYDARHNDVYEKVRIRSGVYVYYDGDGQAVYLAISQGVEGLSGYGAYYDRMYYISQGKLVFAFFEGDDEHRLYYYEEELLRWLYRPYAGAESIYHDQENSYLYRFWESVALQELEEFKAYLTR